FPHGSRPTQRERARKQTGFHESAGSGALNLPRRRLAFLGEEATAQALELDEIKTGRPLLVVGRRSFQLFKEQPALRHFLSRRKDLLFCESNPNPSAKDIAQEAQRLAGEPFECIVA